VIARDLGGRAVVALSIELDDYALVSPQGIDPHTAHHSIDLRDGQPCRLA
jgi:hypothetical protein